MLILLKRCSCDGRVTLDSYNMLNMVTYLPEFKLITLLQKYSQTIFRETPKTPLTNNCI